MRKQIKQIAVKGTASVVGIVNYNGEDPLGRPAANSNHKFAKQDHNSIDYTSSSCLRHYMFKEEVPNQPAELELYESFPELAGSIVGLLRGGTVLVKKSKMSITSPLKVMPSRTVAKSSVLVNDFGSKSTSVKTGKTVDENGEERGSSLLHTKDNAGARKQTVEMFIIVEELQSLNMNKMIHTILEQKDAVDRVLNSVKKTLESLGVISFPKVQSTVSATAITKSPEDRILFTDEQTSVLAKEGVNRLADLKIYTMGASYKVDTEDLVVEVTYDDGSSSALTIKEFNELMESGRASFFKYFTVV